MPASSAIAGLLAASGPAEPGPDRRQAARVMTVHRASAVESGDHRGLCVIKNLSSGGAMIDTLLPLELDEPVSLVMASGFHVAGRVRWRTDRFAGIVFDIPVEPSLLLARHEAERGRAGRRMPRLPCSVPASVVDRGTVNPVMTIDICTHGISFFAEDPIATGPATLKLPKLPPMGVRILWGADGRYGCAFDRPFDVAGITTWLGEAARSQHGPDGPAPTASRGA